MWKNKTDKQAFARREDFEEKLMQEDGMENTRDKLIHIGHPVAFDEELLLSQMEQLQEAAIAGDEDIHLAVASVVSKYHAES